MEIDLVNGSTSLTVALPPDWFVSLFVSSWLFDPDKVTVGK